MAAKEAQFKVTVIEAILVDYRERLVLTANDAVKAFLRTKISEGETNGLLTLGDAVEVAHAEWPPGYSRPLRFNWNSSAPVSPMAAYDPKRTFRQATFGQPFSFATPSETGFFARVAR